jgi:CRISP-associated protein Cas1
LRRRSPKTMNALRGIEGRAAQAYFNAWRSYQVRWKSTERRPIPDDWRFIGQRQSMAPNKQSNRNRNASHPVNAMLNYAYGVLRSRVHQKVLIAGFEPSIGYLHGNYRDRAALVYDLMEPLRPIADRGVLEFVRQHVFEPADFTLSREGVCRLNPHLARALVKNADLVAGIGEIVSEFAADLR